ncbi:cell division protein FtsQ/DivIB [Pullulanibacillus camelliae]|nr:FtsQ-type POTRA domain-containing protein [Pullulanibacillus camelliae]
MPEKKVIQLEDRIPKLKAQRKQKANRRMIFYLTILFILILAVVYFESPLSNVHTLSIKGNDYVSKQQIARQSGVTKHSKIWDIDEQKIERSLKKLPMIKHADVQSHFPGTVTIAITEYTKVAYLQKDDRYYPVLSSGKIMNDVSGKALPSSAPIIKGVEQGKPLKAVTKQIMALNPAIKHGISEIVSAPSKYYDDELHLYMNDGNEVIVTTSRLASKLNHFYPSVTSTLKDNERGILDLTVGQVFTPYEKSKKSSDKSSE